MSRYYYDLHIHSCLSPCADDGNTPNDLVGMGVLAGLQLMALTDHNTCDNCPAFFEAAKRQGIIPIPGMELTTAEDIHMVCLFPSLEEAMAFHRIVQTRRVRIPNRPDIFGEQLLMDGEDNIVGQESDMLSNATTITVEESVLLAAAHGGVCYPAHIDREANGILAVLGGLPPDIVFTCVELHDGEKEAEYRRRYPELVGKPIVVSSDAHCLWDVQEKGPYFELEDTPYSSDRVRHALIRHLRGE